MDQPYTVQEQGTAHARTSAQMGKRPTDTARPGQAERNSEEAAQSGGGIPYRPGESVRSGSYVIAPGVSVTPLYQGATGTASTYQPGSTPASYPVAADYRPRTVYALDSQITPTPSSEVILEGGNRTLPARNFAVALPERK